MMAELKDKYDDYGYIVACLSIIFTIKIYTNLGALQAKTLRFCMFFYNSLAVNALKPLAHLKKILLEDRIPAKHKTFSVFSSKKLFSPVTFFIWVD
jgi:hypothetical protein